MGGCIISKNILEGKGKLKWCVREESVNNLDNGWRFFSNIDTEEFLSDAKNMCIYNYDSIVEIEPAVLSIYELPIGTDLTLIEENGTKFFVETETGERV